MTGSTGQDIRGLMDRYTHLWRERRLSNFEYLMELNLLSGRSLADLSQYPGMLLSLSVLSSLNFHSLQSFPGCYQITTLRA